MSEVDELIFFCFSNMGKFCCVPGCNNRANRDKFDAKGQAIGYFQFPPENDSRRATWIRNIRRDPGPYFSISGTTCVCSMHFDDEYIERLAISTGFRLRLTKEAIPTIFSWNSDDFKEGIEQGDNDEVKSEEDADGNGEMGNGHDSQNGDEDESGTPAGSSKRKIKKPHPRATKTARRGDGQNGSADGSDEEVVRLRGTVQVFERKFAEMSRLVNELRSTTIKMLGVMSAGTQQSQ